jgi:hypothetical protein
MGVDVSPPKSPALLSEAGQVDLMRIIKERAAATAVPPGRAIVK